jgi:hypothetical protein
MRAPHGRTAPDFVQPSTAKIRGISQPYELFQVAAVVSAMRTVGATRSCSFFISLRNQHLAASPMAVRRRQGAIVGATQQVAGTEAARNGLGGESGQRQMSTLRGRWRIAITVA